MFNSIFRVTVVFVLTAFAALVSETAFAQDIGQIGQGLCEVVDALTGTVGQGISTLAVLFLGIGAFFGKVNWGLAVMVAVGIAAIFGAKEVVGIVSSSGAQGCT